MLIHSVYFWLKKDLDANARAEFVKSLEGLKAIESIDDIYVGSPAPTDRPAVDRTYDIGITVLMKDMAVHDDYQKHPLHTQFLEKHSKDWLKVTIFDHQ